MDYSQYESYGFDRISAFNISTGYEERSYQTHWHSYGEILLVGPGKMNVFQVGDETYELAEGDFILIWPMESHAVVDADRKESVVIQFSSAFINALFDLRRIMRMFRNMHIICIHRHPELAAKLRVITDRMKEVFFSRQRDWELRCCMLLMEFIMTLDEYQKELKPELSGVEKYSRDDSAYRRIALVTEYIRNNLAEEDLSESAIAEKAGVSRDYFSRIFCGVTGQNYSRWLNAVRIEKAVELLGLKGMTLTEVAMLSGFQSLSSFNRVFREEKGMAPGEFRNRKMPPYPG